MRRVVLWALLVVFAPSASKGFPLRVVLLDASGAPSMTVETTRIERKSLPDSDFEIPAGYTKKSI